MIRNIIPQQQKGKQTTVSKSIHMTTAAIAMSFFETVKKRFLDINHWHEYSGDGSASFQLTTADGEPIKGSQAEIGHLIRIELPSPPNPTGSGYDWVRVEAIENKYDYGSDEEFFGFRVRPVSNPKQSKAATAHFYTKEATSSFILTRKRNTLTAAEEGRNEKANLETGSFWADTRNALVGFSAMLGLSRYQWDGLVEGILEN